MTGPSGCPAPRHLQGDDRHLPPGCWEGLSAEKLADLQKTPNKKFAPSSAQRDLFPGQGRAGSPGLLQRTGPFGDLAVGSSQVTVKSSGTQTSWPGAQEAKQPYTKVTAQPGSPAGHGGGCQAGSVRGHATGGGEGVPAACTQELGSLWGGGRARPCRVDLVCAPAQQGGHKPGAAEGSPSPGAEAWVQRGWGRESLEGQRNGAGPAMCEAGGEEFQALTPASSGGRPCRGKCRPSITHPPSRGLAQPLTDPGPRVSLWLLGPCLQ